MGRTRIFNSDKYIDRKYNRLTITSYSHCEERVQFNKQRNKDQILKYHFFNVICECGEKRTLRINRLTTGSTKSCGCLQREIVSKIAKERRTHLKSDHKLYRVYHGMKSRCYYKKHDHFKRYGGRGIKICDEWLESFENFYKWAVKSGYKNDLTIDRINNDGDYSPDNCRWSTQSEQTRNTSRNVFLTYKNQTKTAVEWSEVLGVNESLITSRVRRGYSDQQALTMKVGDRR